MKNVINFFINYYEYTEKSKFTIFAKLRLSLLSKSKSVKTHWFTVKNHCLESYKSST